MSMLRSFALLPSLLLLASPSPAHAWETWGGTWYSGDFSFDQVCIPVVVGSCAGEGTDAFVEAAGNWNDTLGTPSFDAYLALPEFSPYPMDGISQAFLIDRGTMELLYGPLSIATPAGTWIFTDGADAVLAEADILLPGDALYTVTRETAALGGPWYLPGVFAHELGYAALLNDEDRVFTLMNSQPHVAPGSYAAPHADEASWVGASFFSGAATPDLAMLPYAPGSGSGGLTAPFLVAATLLEAGDTFEVGGFGAERWTPGDAADLQVDFFLLPSGGSAADATYLNSAVFGGVLSGYQSTGVGLEVPIGLEGDYDVVGSINLGTAAADLRDWNNNWTFGTLTIAGVSIDEDGDGYPPPEDCDDSDPLRNPGVAEACDGVDNNCDGELASNEEDADLDGFRGCEGDCLDTDSSVNPAEEEVCDGIDNNCNGDIDEGCQPGDDDDDDDDDDSSPGDDDDDDDQTDDLGFSGCGCQMDPAGHANPAPFLLLLAMLGGTALLRSRQQSAHLGLPLLLCLSMAGMPNQAPAQGQSHPMEQLLVSISEYVAVGTVVETEVSPWGPAQVPMTTVRVAVEECWVGPCPDSFELLESGGPLPGGGAMWRAGSVRYETGSEGLFLVERTSGGNLVAAGGRLGALEMSGGKLRVRPPAAPGVVQRSPIDTPVGPMVPFVGQTLEQAYGRVVTARNQQRLGGTRRAVQRPETGLIRLK